VSLKLFSGMMCDRRYAIAIGFVVVKASCRELHSKVGLLMWIYRGMNTRLGNI
jgi:hypothetical protein